MHQFGLELALKMLENTRSKEQTGNEKKSHNPGFRCMHWAAGPGGLVVGGSNESSKGCLILGLYT